MKLGIHCYNCNEVTTFDREPTYDDACPFCEERKAEGQSSLDPTAVCIIQITKCDAENRQECQSDWHHWGTGLHYVDDPERPERLEREARDTKVRSELSDILREIA